MSSGTRAVTPRLLAVGDIHGCVSELEVLLAEVSPGESDRLVFLGDYVDRGPGARQAIDLLLDVRRRLPRTVFLRGNHEEMMLGYLGVGGRFGVCFLHNGGAERSASYGIGTPARTAAMRAEEALVAIPEEHLRFLDDARALVFAEGGYTFVHAGVRPGIELEAQCREDLLWIREPFLHGEHGLPTTIVFGHTPQGEVQFDVPWRIGMDTGCVYGGRLSCIDLTNGELFQVRRGTRTATRIDVSSRLAGRR